MCIACFKVKKCTKCGFKDTSLKALSIPLELHCEVASTHLHLWSQREKLPDLCRPQLQSIRLGKFRLCALAGRSSEQDSLLLTAQGT